MAKQKKLLPAGNLKYKLRIAFCLMSVLPLLVCAYLVANYVLPRAGFKLDFTMALSILISVFISGIGFFVVKEVFDRVVSISTDAKKIAEGDISRVIDTQKEDEVGFLGDSLNQMTRQIRNSMEELKNYSEKTAQINTEIQKRVLALASLLQISSFISQGVKLDEIFKLAVEKSLVLAGSDRSFLLFRDTDEGDFYVKASEGGNVEHSSKITINPSEPAFKQVIRIARPAVFDAENPVSDHIAASFHDKFGLKNLLILPIFLRGKVTGILGIGNNQDKFVYHKEDVELMDIFVKQISIAIENDLLARSVEKLEVKDALTGLYNDSFIRNRLQEEIKRAIIYQRPCAFAIFDIDNFGEIQQAFGSLFTEAVIKKIAVLIKDSVTEVDRVGRTGDNEFSVIMPEKNKRNAHELVETIRKKIEFAFGEEQDAKKKMTVSVAVSENPLDGLTSEELVNKAKQLLEQFKSQGRNRVLV